MAARKTAKAQETSPAAKEAKDRATAPVEAGGGQPEAPAAGKAESQDEAPPEGAKEQAVDPGIVVAEVVEKFRDKESGSVLKAGLTIAVAPARFEELEAAGVVEKRGA